MCVFVFGSLFLGMGFWPQNPKPQSPIPNPQSPFSEKKLLILFYNLILLNITLIYNKIICNFLLLKTYFAFEVEFNLLLTTISFSLLFFSLVIIKLEFKLCFLLGGILEIRLFVELLLDLSFSLLIFTSKID